MIFFPITVEACSSGFHSVSSNSQSPVIQNEKKSDLKEQKTQFNSILMTIEKENTAVLERLTSLQASRNKIESNIQQKQSYSNEPEAVAVADNQESLSQPIDSCVAMQAQLNRYLQLHIEEECFSGETIFYNFCTLSIFHISVLGSWVLIPVLVSDTAL